MTPMNTRSGSQWVLLILILLNAATLFHVITARTTVVVADHLPDALSRLSTDDQTRLGLSGNLPNLLLLVDPTDASAIAQVNHFLESALAETVKTVIFTPDPTRLTQELKLEVNESELLHIHELPLDDVAEMFKLVIGIDRWVIYDRDGIRRAKGNFLYGGLVGAVSQVTGLGPAFSRETLLAELRSVASFDNERRIAAEHDSGTHVVLFVRRASTGCPIATALRTLQEAAAINPAIAFSVRVPANWDDARMGAFRTTFSLTVPVDTATAVLTSKWDELEDRYGTAPTGGFLAVFDTHGIVGADVGTTAVLTTLQGATLW